jgi:nucleotide-binding universal stress UspA family protein
MIKRILVALDPDTDTPVATRHAAEIAARYQAEVVGMAVVDTGHIEAEMRGGGIGSMYYAEKLHDRLTEEARDTAQQLVRAFEAALAETGIRYGDFVREGVPFRRIIEDMKYHDLLVIGRSPHFFYNHPEEETATLEQVVKQAVAPVFITGDVYRPVRRVLIAYDGSDPSARTLQCFAHLQPFGTGVEVDLLNVYEHEGAESELLLKLAKSYLDAHGFSARYTSMAGKSPDRLIVEYAERTAADVVVAGAHAASRLRKLAFGSTTDSLLKNSPVPLFLHS